MQGRSQLTTERPCQQENEGGENVIVTQQVQLQPTPEQATKLKETLELCNEACNWLSPKIAAEKSRSRMKLQKEYYYSVREQFPKLGAGQTIMAIWQTVDSYKAGKKGVIRQFREHGAMPLHPGCLRPLDADVFQSTRPHGARPA